MHYLIERAGLGLGWLLSSGFIYLRYLLFAGLAFYLFYRWRSSPWSRRKIQPQQPAKRMLLQELLHSLSTAFAFATIGLVIYGMGQLGWTKIYNAIDQYGYSYFIISILMTLFIHDTYFYWLHRALHHPRLFRRVHRIHHQSFNPTPLAAFSFHPVESILEIGFLPLWIVLVPIHPAALLVFASLSLLWNVIGHLGYEIFPKGFVRHPVGRWFNTSTHHNMHHARGKSNYGLYFNFWDTWMSTNHPEYRATFEAIHQRQESSAITQKT